jgi:hypothetical protein
LELWAALALAFPALRVAGAAAVVVRATTPKSVVYVAPHEASDGVPMTMPMPISR